MRGLERGLHFPRLLAVLSSLLAVVLAVAGLVFLVAEAPRGDEEEPCPGTGGPPA